MQQVQQEMEKCSLDGEALVKQQTLYSKNFVDKKGVTCQRE